MSLNAWNPVCIHYFQVALEQPLFWKVCIKFEYITEAVYWRFAKANSTRGKISMNILWLLCVMSVPHYAIWTAMFWTNSTNAWRHYVILRNNLRWNYCRFLDCFLATSWHILGSSWWFLQNFFLVRDNFFPPPELSSLLKIHQEATETPSRSQWDANKTTKISSRSDKICQIVTNIFEIFKKYLGASRFIKNCQEVSGSVKKLFKMSPRRY